MAEGAVLWSCPRCGDQNAAEREQCARCGGGPSVFPAPPKKCPACRQEFDDAPLEGKVHCPKCGAEFEDYEEWVRRCRAAAFAATRPPPPVPEEPPPRPPHLKPIGLSLLAMAAVYIAGGAIAGRWEILIPCAGLALLQIVAALSVLQEWRHADGTVRLAAGLSALVPLWVLPAAYFVGLFAFFSRPPVMNFFGTRAVPLTDRLRHPMLAWLLVSIGVAAALYVGPVAAALETARRWNDPLTPGLDLAARATAFFVENWWWAPAGLLAGVGVLSLWGKVSRPGFLGIAVLSIVGVIGLGAPPAVEAWFFERAAKEAETYRGERDVQRLLWGAREAEPDPKVRIVAIQGLAARNAKVVVPSLLRSIKDPDRRVRLAAACALAQFDPSVEDLLPLLIAALEDDRSIEEERDHAAQALGCFGPRARPALSLLLDRLKRSDAATLALVEVGPASIPGLTGALSDGDAKVRKRAARALRLQGPAARSAVPQLLDRLKDGDAGVRREAAAALGEIQREKAIPMLLDLLRSDREASKAAAEALCALGQRDGLAELPQGCTAMNALRLPATWDHLSRAAIDRDVDGTVAEVALDLAERAGTCAEISAEAADLPALSPFRRISAAARKRSVLEGLLSLDLDFVIEHDRIRVLTPEQAKAFWTEWLAGQKKRE